MEVSWAAAAHVAFVGDTDSLSCLQEDHSFTHSFTHSFILHYDDDDDDDNCHGAEDWRATNPPPSRLTF